MANDIIKKRWTSFRRSCIHQDASPHQVNEMKKAFYIGAQVTFSELIDISKNESQEKAEYELEKLEKEFNEFNKKTFMGTTH